MRENKLLAMAKQTYYKWPIVSHNTILNHTIHDYQTYVQQVPAFFSKSVYIKVAVLLIQQPKYILYCMASALLNPLLDLGVW